MNITTSEAYDANTGMDIIKKMIEDPNFNLDEELAKATPIGEITIVEEA